MIILYFSLEEEGIEKYVLVWLGPLVAKKITPKEEYRGQVSYLWFKIFFCLTQSLNWSCKWESEHTKNTLFWGAGAPGPTFHKSYLIHYMSYLLHNISKYLMAFRTDLCWHRLQILTFLPMSSNHAHLITSIQPPY